MVTMADMQAIAGSRSRSQNVKKIMDAFNDLAHEFEVNTPKRIALFLAHASVETGGFRRLDENLNYSVTGLLKTFGRHRISKADAERFGRRKGQRANKVAIANAIYGGAWGKRHLGNIHPNDGWDYRGSGPGQTTGRANFQRVSDETGIDFVGNPELMRDARQGMLAMFILWKKWKMNDYADSDRVTASRKRWNGGNHGLKETIDAWRRGLKRDLSVPVMSGKPDPKPEPAPVPEPPLISEPVPKPSKGLWAALAALFGGLAAYTGDRVEIIQKMTELLK